MTSDRGLYLFSPSLLCKNTILSTLNFIINYSMRVGVSVLRRMQMSAFPKQINQRIADPCPANPVSQ